MQYAPAILTLLAAAEIGAGLVHAQSTSMARRLQADVDLLANTGATAADRDRAQADLLAAIRTPGGQERFVVMFENAAFAIPAGNWLENVRTSNAPDRTSVCDVAMGVLHNTTDNQLIMAMIHAVLRQVVNQVQDDPNINPISLAARVVKELKAEVHGAGTRSKMNALRDISNAMTDEEVTSAQRKFLQQVSVLSGQRPRSPTSPKLSASKPQP